MSPGKDETRICGYIYIYIRYINERVYKCKYLCKYVYKYVYIFNIFIFPSSSFSYISEIFSKVEI